MTHPSQDLDEVVHQKTRLGVLTVLAGVRKADFTFLKQTLDLTDGNLSRHLRVLQEAGMVHLEKVFEERKPRTWVRITKMGRGALTAELKSLSDMIAGVGQAGS
ncbi:MAG: winged helix-turn-helix domain-containing protein [Actinomycetota bacterium]